MATRGVYQLKQLTLHYCEVGGSSRAVREYLGNGQLAAWATAHPHIEITVKPRNGHHPFVHAQYHTRSKTIHQVSVKNVDSWEQVQSVMDMLSNRSGRKITKLTKPVLTDSPSVQGVWTPFLDLYRQPPFRVEFVHVEGQEEDRNHSNKPAA